MRRRLRLANQKNDHYLEFIDLINSDYILPGIESLLKKIKAQHIKIALGSASKNALKVLEKLGLDKLF